MIRIQFTFFMMFLALSTYGQSDASQLEEQNEKLKTELLNKENVIQNLKKEIVYYKETLQLMESKISSEDKEVTFKINNVQGDSTTGKVFVEGILINKGATRRIQGWKASAFDPKGNGIMSYQVKLGKYNSIEKLLKDVPTNFNLELEQIVEGTPIITALIIDFYSRIGTKSDNLNVVFKNLRIDWK